MVFWISIGALSLVTFALINLPLLKPAIANGAKATRAGKMLAAGVILFLPVAALGLYWQMGKPDIPDTPLAQRDAEVEQAAQMGQIQDMVNRLAAKLAENPKDGKKWAMLGRSYKVLDRIEDSVIAYRRAYELLPDDVIIAGDLAEVLIYEADGQTGSEALTIFKAVLAKDPKDLRARFFISQYLASAPDTQSIAISMWQEMIAEANGDEPWIPFLKSRIEELKQGS